MPVFESLVRDLRYAFRMLRKTPGFTIAAAVTLALGIGANTAVFSVVNALLFTPLPYPGPDRLALLEYHTRDPKAGDNRDVGADGRMWLAVRDYTSTIDAAVLGGTAGVNLVAGDRAAYVQQQRVSAGYFHVVGILPTIGREFTRDEDVAGGPAVVILNYPLWKSMFNADPSIVGRTIQLRGESYTVIGVLPENFPITQRSSFSGGQGVDLWTPLRPSTTGEGGGINYSVVARLHDGVNWAQAQDDVHNASSHAFPHVDPGTIAELGLVPMQQAMTASIREPLMMLWGAVGIVLLIACVNIAGLLLARGATRTREVATRMALGSGRAAVIRQLLVESVALASIGGVLGLAVGWLVLKAIGDLAAQTFDLWQPLSLDGRALAVTILFALGTSIVFGLAPAIQAARLDVRAGLGEGGTRGVAGASNRWPRRVLVVAEVALGVVLLISSGLLVRTFVHLRDLAPGFNDRNLVSISVSLQDARYKDPVAVQGLFDETLRRIRSIPGVEGAGVALGMPYTRLLNNGMRRVDGPEIDATGAGKITNESYVTPGFFETLQVPVRQGRAFTDADTASSPLVAVVNEAFVARYFKKDPAVIGRHLASGKDVREIVGVVGNIQQGSAGWGNFEPISPLPCLYVPVSQTSSGFLTLVHTWFQPSWAVRTSLPLETVVPRIREVLQGVDPHLPIAQVSTIDDLRGEKLVSQRFMMLLVAGLGVLALVLSAVGLQGLIASSVSERTRELGVRLALGATGSQVMGNVVVPGLTIALVGVTIGSLAALATTRLMQSFIWGVKATDPLTFIAVVATLLAVALLASVIPAMRVLRLDPAKTLRAE
ncbi:MAG TPA: ABC transporter permease [Vicinamibacterales bacterium]|nr:ABC transporter permease [Vicinamibacterales bacterium]